MVFTYRDLVYITVILSMALYLQSDGGKRQSLKDLFTKFNQNDIHPEIVSKTLEICSEYLGGAWSLLKGEQIIITQIGGGMSNLLFLVKLPEYVKSVGDEPRRTLLRIQNEVAFSQLLTESVIFTIFSERSLGPKMYAIFEGGRLEEYLPSRSLNTEEIFDRRLIPHIASNMAQIHSLSIPVQKKPEIVNFMRLWLKQFENANGSQIVQMSLAQADVDPNLFPSHLTCEDLAKEIDYVESFLKTAGGPIVFGHNDINPGNTLILDGYSILNDGQVEFNGKRTERNPLLLIDYEYSGYNYRGFDIGNHFSEYGFDYEFPEHPFYKVNKERFHMKEEHRMFCEAYLEEIYKLRASGQKIHSISGNRDADLQRLLDESDVFIGIAHLFWSIWGFMKSTEQSTIDFDYGHSARDRLALYFERKSIFEEFKRKYGN